MWREGGSGFHSCPLLGHPPLALQPALAPTVQREGFQLWLHNGERSKERGEGVGSRREKGIWSLRTTMHSPGHFTHSSSFNPHPNPNGPGYKAPQTSPRSHHWLGLGTIQIRNPICCCQRFCLFFVLGCLLEIGELWMWSEGPWGAGLAERQ